MQSPQIPLFTGQLHSSEQDLAEPLYCLDNAEDRFDSTFSFGVKSVAIFALQPMVNPGTIRIVG